MIKLPTNKGKCSTCSDKNDCPMPHMLKEWKTITDEYGENVKELRPDLWDEHSITEPDIENNEVIWCPMHHKEIVVEITDSKGENPVKIKGIAPGKEEMENARNIFNKIKEMFNQEKE